MVMLLQKISTNMDLVFYQWLKMILGATYMDVSKPKTTHTRQILTEKISNLGSFLSHQQAIPRC
jgi:selenophosphate synthetase-related protein